LHDYAAESNLETRPTFGVLIDPLPEKEYLKIIDQMKTSRHALGKDAGL